MKQFNDKVQLKNTTRPLDLNEHHKIKLDRISFAVSPSLKGKLEDFSNKLSINKSLLIRSVLSAYIEDHKL
jgi:hypothetical protein